MVGGLGKWAGDIGVGLEDSGHSKEDKENGGVRGRSDWKGWVEKERIGDMEETINKREIGGSRRHEKVLKRRER